MGEAATRRRRPWAITAIIVLLLPQLATICGLFPFYAFTQGGIGLRIFAVGLAVFTLMTLAGLWRQKPWALWATLVVVSLKATLDLFGWATHLDRLWAPVSGVFLAAVAILVFRQGASLGPRVGSCQRVLFGFVLAFAGWVAVWGLLFPALIGTALPLNVPPLHARFLGVMYLSGAVFMLLGMLAKEWHEVRVVTVILAAWTGMLGLVSALNLSAFDWARGPTWFWFVAYVGYPLIALWIAWCQRAETEHPGASPMSHALRNYLYAQGVAAVALALFLLVAPAFMVTVWPWTISSVLAQIYGAPFLSYGLGSLYAARQRTWSEVRIVVLGTVVFTLGVFAASLLHRSLFDPATPSAWLWFGGFGLATVALAAFALRPSLRNAP